MPPMPKAPVPAAPPNDFTSMEQRQAALRARGLLPAAVPRQFRGGDGFMMPLSEQEAEIDRRFTIVVPGDSSTEDEGAASEANRIRKAWLSKQAEASSSSLSEVDKDEEEYEDKVKAVTAAEIDPLPPRKSDAAERASKDGMIGERSPVRATFVAIDAPPLSPSAAEFGAGARVASPFEGTEDFHTAPNSPTFPEDKQPLSIERDGHLRAPSPSSPTRANRPPLTLATSASTVDDAPPLSPTKEQHPSPSGSPSTHSAEKVSRWLRDSSDMPTPVPLSETAIGAITTSDQEPVLSASPRGSFEAPPSPSPKSETVRSRREKPPPIVITQPGKAPSHATAAPSDSETSTSSSEAQRSRRSLSGSGSGSGTARRPAHAPSIQSRMTATGTLPALSPTRTVSSLGAESSLPTPTTTSCGAPALARDASISLASTSNSSDGGHDPVTTRPRRGTGPGLLNGATSKVPGTGAEAAIPEEFSETEPSSEGGEFGVVTPVPASTRPRASQEGAAVPRPVRAQTLGQATEKAQNRKSFSLFGKKSLEVRLISTLVPVHVRRSSHTHAVAVPQMPRETRTSSSMMNLRRAFTSSKQRPKTTLEVTPEVGRKRSKNFDASHLPPSPTVPNAPTSLAPSSFRGTGRPSNGGLRAPPRQAVAPTMHSHGTIVHQTNFIEDDESRRLSEMAFLT